MRKAANRLAILAPALLLILSTGPADAQASEQAVKAAFLPKFIRYVEWPSDAIPPAGAPLQVCLLGHDPFGKLIDQAVSGEEIAQHPITVKRVTGVDGSGGCQVVFVSSGSSKSNAQVLAALAGRPVLTVTDARDGAVQGMVHFALVDGRVRFHIDEVAAERSKLTISSRLLSLALSVRTRRS